MLSAAAGRTCKSKKFKAALGRRHLDLHANSLTVVCRGDMGPWEANMQLGPFAWGQSGDPACGMECCLLHPICLRRKKRCRILLDRSSGSLQTNNEIIKNSKNKTKINTAMLFLFIMENYTIAHTVKFNTHPHRDRRCTNICKQWSWEKQCVWPELNRKSDSKVQYEVSLPSYIEVQTLEVCFSVSKHNQPIIFHFQSKAINSALAFSWFGKIESSEGCLQVATETIQNFPPVFPAQQSPFRKKTKNKTQLKIWVVCKSVGDILQKIKTIMNDTRWIVS